MNNIEKEVKYKDFFKEYLNKRLSSYEIKVLEKKVEIEYENQLLSAIRKKIGLLK